MSETPEEKQKPMHCVDHHSARLQLETPEEKQERLLSSLSSPQESVPLLYVARGMHSLNDILDPHPFILVQIVSRISLVMCATQ